MPVGSEFWIEAAAAVAVLFSTHWFPSVLSVTLIGLFARSIFNELRKG